MKKHIFFILIFTLVLGTSCSKSTGSTTNMTTDTWSTAITNHDEKINFMKKYIGCPTDVLDAEYHIVYHDNSGGRVPGPSDWTIAAAIKINPGDMARWTGGMDEISSDQVDTAWWDGLNISAWAFSGAGIYYKQPNENSFLAVYQEDGVILKYAYTV